MSSAQVHTPLSYTLHVQVVEDAAEGTEAEVQDFKLYLIQVGRRGKSIEALAGPGLGRH